MYIVFFKYLPLNIIVKHFVFFLNIFSAFHLHLNYRVLTAIFAVHSWFYSTYKRDTTTLDARAHT